MNQPIQFFLSILNFWAAGLQGFANTFSLNSLEQLVVALNGTKASWCHDNCSNRWQLSYLTTAHKFRNFVLLVFQFISRAFHIKVRWVIRWRFEGWANVMNINGPYTTKSRQSENPNSSDEFFSTLQVPKCHFCTIKF